jgi:hypothetical protein
LPTFQDATSTRRGVSPLVDDCEKKDARGDFVAEGFEGNGEVPSSSCTSSSTTTSASDGGESSAMGDLAVAVGAASDGSSMVSLCFVSSPGKVMPEEARTITLGYL